MSFARVAEGDGAPGTALQRPSPTTQAVVRPGCPPARQFPPGPAAALGGAAGVDRYAVEFRSVSTHENPSHDHPLGTSHDPEGARHDSELLAEERAVESEHVSHAVEDAIAEAMRRREALTGQPVARPETVEPDA